MKYIPEIIEKTSQEKLTDIGTILNIKKPSSKNILPALSSFSGIDKVLKTLSLNELRMLRLVYTGDDGITFGAIEKETGITVQEIDKISIKLNTLILAYTTKNRQLLNNKMDKIYGIHEISKILNIYESPGIKEIYGKIKENLLLNRPDPKFSKNLPDDTSVKLIRYIVSLGGIASLEEIELEFKEPFLTKTILFLAGKNVIKIMHNISESFCTLFAINPDMACSAAETLKPSHKKEHSVNNRYSILLNILNAYDVISSFGLFLTKQNEFRKIDRRRITDSLIKLHEFTGETVEEEKATDMPLFILNRLQCLRQQKDIAAVSLSNIQKELDQPEKLVHRIIKNMDTASKEDKYFQNPFGISDSSSIYLGIELFDSIESGHINLYSFLLQTHMIEEALKKSINDVLSAREDIKNRTSAILNFLTLFGIIEIKSGIASFSEIGSIISGKDISSDIDIPKKKSIYINPDFTLHIPVKELSSSALYHIISHTDIMKDDVILNTAISKSSIIRAYKRGMNLKRFLEVLETYSKNEMPQNLSFLLTEWSNQAIKIKITDVILMHTNHPTFLDEIQYSKSKAGMIERISPNYAIVHKDHLDDILKTARKNDALISLFEDIAGS